MAYRVEIEPSASRAIRSLDRVVRERLNEALAALADEPRPPGCAKLSGLDAWRILVGACRVIYEIHDRILLVVVIDTGHRRQAYRAHEVTPATSSAPARTAP